jgi:outer membrane receptor protein involved in Fe transport
MFSTPLRYLYLATLPALFPGLSLAHENHAGPLEELVVYGRAEQQIGIARAASEGMVGYDDIRLPPLLRVGELVEAVPGMVATQHSGTGKANQYFLRGFNLDHGTDFSAHVEGVPINMRTHGHGQGYLDLNFMIPELVETTTYRKGPYDAAAGDFSSAGSVVFDYHDRLKPALSVTVGSYDYYRGLAAGSLDTNAGVLSAALEATAYEGPWDLDENLRQYRMYLNYGFQLGDAFGHLRFEGYDGSWDSTDQIPRRAVEQGLIDERGFIDPDLGGETSRYAFSGALDFGSWGATAYAVGYDFTLFSNFTYLLEDPIEGDQFEQRDNRVIYGANVAGASDHTFAGRPTILRWGGDFRYDDIDEVGLYPTSARVRTDVIRDDTVEELSFAAFGEAELAITERLRAILGIRGDYYDWEVDAVESENSGRGDDTLVSPKVSLAYRVNDGLEAYANWGQGFHSNDVRGATISVDPLSGDPVDPVDVLVASRGAELGFRLERGSTFNLSLVGFRLELNSELVFVGDAGATEPSGRTLRRGVELNGFWQTTDWLAVDASYTYTDAEFTQDEGDGTSIPGAVKSTFTLGGNAFFANGIGASLRLRYLSPAPLIEDNSVRSESSLLLNGGVSWRHRALEARLDVFNLLDSNDDDISYFYASRLPDEPLEGVKDVHFHPLEPRSVRVTLNWHFGAS